MEREGDGEDGICSKRYLLVLVRKGGFFSGYIFRAF